MKPLVSIVIPVYNGANYLKGAIESALKQTYNNIEVVIINDGSDDGGETERIALSYGNKVNYYYKENGGVATALNLAVEVMKGEYFSWLSHDDLYRDNKIEAEMEEIRKSGDKMKIVYSNYSIWDIEADRILIDRLEMLYPINQLENGCFPVFMGAVSGCTVLFHREHFTRVGLLKKELDTAQDYDMWFRLFQGQNTKFITSPLVTIRSHAEQGSRVKKHYKIEQDQLYIDFMRRLGEQEKKKVFGGNRQFYCTMIEKYKRWRIPRSYEQARRELLKLEREPDGEERMGELKKAVYSAFPQECEDIFLFGAGRIGQGLLLGLRLRRIEVKGFIDNSVEKQGRHIDGLVCKALSEIDKNSGIIVAIKDSREEIVLQLEEAGYHNIICNYGDIEQILRGAPIDKKCLEQDCYQCIT